MSPESELDFNQALAVERYRFSERKSFGGRLRLAAYECMLLLTWKGVGRAAERGELCFFQSIRRAGYDRLFGMVCRSYLGPLVVWRPQFARLPCLSGLLAAWRGVRVWRSLCASGPLERLFLYALASRGKALVGEVGDSDVLGLVVFSDMQFLDALLVQRFQERGVVTATLQHALYQDLGYGLSRNSMNYLGSRADWVLCWGSATAELFRKYRGECAKLLVVGNPSLLPIEREQGGGEPRWLSVVLDYDDHREGNREMLRIAQVVAERLGFLLNVRPHPRGDARLYGLSEKDLRAGLELEGSEIVVGHTSTLLYELAARGLPVFVYASREGSRSEPAAGYFSDESGLLALVEQARAGARFDVSERYISEIGSVACELYRDAFAALLGKERAAFEQVTVSVITAAFASLDTLPRTAASVRDQVGLEVEHIVVDGGSTDGSVKWLEENMPREAWTSESDKGIADAMNKGAERARGEWLLFLQADDWLVSVESLAKALDAWDGVAELIACPIRFDSGRVIEPRCDRAYYRWFKQGILHQGALIRRSAFKRIGLYDTDFRVTMDYDWFMRAHRGRITVQLLREPLAVMGEGGVSSSVDWVSLRARLTEEQRSRLLRSPSVLWRMGYRAYWPVYLGYRYVGSLLRYR